MTGDPDVNVGLCSLCTNARVVKTRGGSRFYLCERSVVDTAFAKYPALPVLDCPGFDTMDETQED